jgi:RNA polymerase sigma-70 factor (ECF subfamily)
MDGRHSVTERERAAEIPASESDAMPTRPEGQQDAQALFRAHAGFVAAFLRRLGTPSADVDDLVQEVFLIAHRKGGFVPGTGQPKTWLAAICVRIASTSRRSRSRRREEPLGDASYPMTTDVDPARALEAKRSLARVQRALDALDLDQRAAFILYELEGVACESIATSFGIPLGTVYSRLHHARKRFTEAHAALALEDNVVRRPRLVEGT